MQIFFYDFFRNDTKISAKSQCINLEISRIGGTIAFCDYLVRVEMKIYGSFYVWLLFFVTAERKYGGW